MRVSCGCLAKTASKDLADKIRAIGVEPIVTSQIIRAVYDGKDKSIGEAIVLLFSEEVDHDVYVHYDRDEIQPYKPIEQHPRSSDRKKRRKH